MSSLHVLGEGWSLKRSLASLWTRRQWSWLGWPILAGLVLVVLYGLYKWSMAFVAGWESFRIAFLTDELSQMPYGFTVNQWEIYRSTTRFEAWFFVVACTAIALAIALLVYNIRKAHIRRVRFDEKVRQEHAGEMKYAQGYEEGRAFEQMRVYPAVIHHFKPKVDLPPVPAGCTREFYVRVKVSHPGALPTDDRRVHFSDFPLGTVAWGVIGAPHYDWVLGDPTRLIMLDVVYTLDATPTHWFGE